MQNTAGEGGLRERLQRQSEAQSEERLREIVEEAAAEIARAVEARTAGSEARIREAVEQGTADLAHQVERMQRLASRASWMRAGVVGMGIAAGAIGAALVLLIQQLLR